MKKLFENIKMQLIDNNDIVLVTVIASSGSTPRGPGAHMVVTKAGRIYGTIGGGAVEYKSTLMAMDVLDKKTSLTHEFILSRNEIEDLGMICGGNATVYFRYISYRDRDFLNLTDNLLKIFEKGETSWLITCLNKDNQGKMGVYGIKSGMFGFSGLAFDYRKLTHQAQHIQIDGKEYYAEELMQSGKVYIFGCGHVAQELVPVLAHVGFRCVAADDRPEFACDKLFPDAERVLLIDFMNIGKDITITGDDAVCIMTRGHSHDTDVEIQVLNTNAYYIGVIGSANKIAAASKVLREHGFSEEKIASIHTPIGLPIKAETPAEIAISIGAELILERAKKFRS